MGIARRRKQRPATALSCGPTTLDTEDSRARCTGCTGTGATAEAAVVAAAVAVVVVEEEAIVVFVGVVPPPSAAAVAAAVVVGLVVAVETVASSWA